MNYDAYVYPTAGQGSGYDIRILISWMYFELQESSWFHPTLGKRSSEVIAVNSVIGKNIFGQASNR